MIALPQGSLSGNLFNKKSVRAVLVARSTNGGSGLSIFVERANLQKPHAEYV